MFLSIVVSQPSKFHWPRKLPRHHRDIQPSRFR